MDENLTIVMRYQKVEKVSSLMKSVLVLIPFIGGLSADFLSGGRTVLTEAAGRGFSLSGIVQSVLGIFKDWSGFVSEPVVDRFLKAFQEVLKDEVWNSTSASNKHAVRDAVEELVISVEELKTRVDDLMSSSLGEQETPSQSQLQL